MKRAIWIVFIMGFLLSLFILNPALSSEDNVLSKTEIKQLVNAYQNGEQLTAKELLSIKGFYEPQIKGNNSHPNYSVLQDTVFEEHFTTGALPAGWQNVANIDTGGVWEFNNPGARTFNSTTSADGFAIFDSDNYGPDGAAEDADLITPPIDCSTLSVVALRFEHYFDAGFGGAGEVFVSGDNGANWTSLESWGATDSPNAETKTYDISSLAAGQSQVLVRWNWTGDWSWYWCLDDVTVGSFEIPLQLNPPLGLEAESGLEIQLTWTPPLGPGELGYDNGTSEQIYGFGATGEFAVRFTPNVYPSTLLAIKTYWDSSATTPLDNDVEYSVWVDSAGSAAPDSEVVPNTAHTIPFRNDWSEVDISSAAIVINEGDFFYAWAQIDTFNFGIGLDTDGPVAGRAWLSFDGVVWTNFNGSPYFAPVNFMIRALVQEGTGPNSRIVEISSDGSRREVNLPAPTNIDNNIPKAKFLKHNKLFRSAPSISSSYRTSRGQTSVRALTGYNVYRDDVFLASTDTNTTSYLDGNVVLGTTYTYHVTAVYDEGESGPSNEASATAAAEALMSLTHTPGDLNAAIFNDGSIGTDNENFIGPGVTWKGENGLFTGGPIFGTSGVGSVNGLFGSYGVFGDLIDIASDFAGGFTSDANFDQIAEVTLADLGAPVPYGVDILQKSYSNTGEEFTFIRYGYVNNSGGDLNDFYAGLVLDWDVGNYLTNSGGISVAENLTYQYDTADGDTAVYYGAAALDGLAGWKVTSDPAGIADPRGDSFERISTPDTEPLDSPEDFRSWLGAGPFNIAAGDTQWVTFALVAGDDLDGIKANAAAAKMKALELGWIRITAPKLLISEIVARPTPGEYVEIYNPNSEAVDLSDYYLANSVFQGGNTYYFQVVEGDSFSGGGGDFGDWNARFPEGATIDPAEYQTIAMVGDSLFFATYGVLPTYEVYEDSSDFANDVPDMREASPGSIDRGHADNLFFGVLSNGDEDMTLYYWDGATDLVGDVDYVIWDEGDGGINEETDKTGVRIDGPDANTDSSEYLPDTPIANQVPAPINNLADGWSTHRVDYTEGNQIASGGNGVTGADETSEDLNNTFTALSVPTPNGPWSPPSVLLQAIHNAADPLFAIIDVYLDGVLTGDDWAFRTATPFEPFPAGVTVNVGIALGSSSSVNDTLYNFPVVLEPGQTYVAVLSGVRFPQLHTANPDGRDIELDFFETDSARMVSSISGQVDFQVMHGVTDAPKVDVQIREAGGATIVDNLGYGDISDYVASAPGAFTLDVTDSTGSTNVASFTADLSALADSAVTVFASGFLVPGTNEPAFGLFAALPGGAVVELPVVVGIADNANIPTTFAISQNYPNPFNPTTSIKYQLPQTADVTITIYNLLGQKVRTLVNEKKEPGYYEVAWNGLNDHDVQVATGLYIYRIKAADFVSSKKMLLLK